MSQNKILQENIDLYSNFYIKYNFKEDKGVKPFDKVLKEINSMKLLNFEPKYELKSVILENLLPELKTNLKLDFKKYQFKIEKDNIAIIFPKEAGYTFPDPRILSRFITRPSFFTKEKEYEKISIKELNEMNDIFKLYLIQKFFELEKPMDPISIDIISFISMPKGLNLNFINDSLKKSMNSNKVYEVPSIDFEITENTNVYSISIEKEISEVFSTTFLKSNITWQKSILELLNDNIIKIKEIFTDLKV